MTALDLFEARVRVAPDAVAVVCGDASVTYASLDADAARLAVMLAARGAHPGSVVAVLMGRSAGLVTALLAVWKAGAAYLPVDPNYPAERVEYMLGAGHPAVGMTDSTEFLADAVAGIPPVAGVCDLIPRTPGPLDAAYVMFTSGSTGGRQVV